MHWAAIIDGALKGGSFAGWASLAWNLVKERSAIANRLTISTTRHDDEERCARVVISYAATDRRTSLVCRIRLVSKRAIGLRDETMRYAPAPASLHPIGFWLRDAWDESIKIQVPMKIASADTPSVFVATAHLIFYTPGSPQIANVEIEIRTRGGMTVLRHRTELAPVD